MGDSKVIMANTMDAPVVACDRDQPNSSCHIGNIMLTDDRAPNVNAVAAKQIATTIQPRFLFAVSKSITDRFFSNGSLGGNKHTYKSALFYGARRVGLGIRHIFTHDHASS